MNLLMLSWVAAYLPRPYHQATLCSAGSDGYCAFRRSLQPGYPAHTILATNVNIIDDLGTSTNESKCNNNHPPLRHPFSVIYKVDPLLRLARNQGPKGSFLQDIVRIQVPPFVTSSSMHDDDDDSAHHLSLISNVQHLPPGLLSRCGARTIDLRGLSPLGSRLCDWFTAFCPELTSVDFGAGSSSPFSQVAAIPMCFLEKCPKLKSIDLSSFKSVTTIPVWFLRDCIGLKSLSFPTWGNVTELPYGFLEGCAGLVTIDLMGFKNVVRIGKKFMFGCTSLKSIDLTSLTNLTAIERKGFLGGCSSLVSVDMTGMVWLDVVRDLGADKAAAHVLESTSETWVSDDEND